MSNMIWFETFSKKLKKLENSQIKRDIEISKLNFKVKESQIDINNLIINKVENLDYDVDFKMLELERSVKQIKISNEILEKKQNQLKVKVRNNSLEAKVKFYSDKKSIFDTGKVIQIRRVSNIGKERCSNSNSRNSSIQKNNKNENNVFSSFKIGSANRTSNVYTANNTKEVKTKNTNEDSKTFNFNSFSSLTKIKNIKIKSQDSLYKAQNSNDITKSNQEIKDISCENTLSLNKTSKDSKYESEKLILSKIKSNLNSSSLKKLPKYASSDKIFMETDKENNSSPVITNKIKISKAVSLDLNNASSSNNKINAKNSNNENILKSYDLKLKSSICKLKKSNKIALIMASNMVVPINLRYSLFLSCPAVAKNYPLKDLIESMVYVLLRNLKKIKQKLSIYTSNTEVLKQVEQTFSPSKTVQVFLNMITLEDEISFKQSHDVCTGVLSKALLILLMENEKLDANQVDPEYMSLMASPPSTKSFKSSDSFDFYEISPTETLFKQINKLGYGKIKDLIFYHICGNIYIYPHMHLQLEQLIHDNEDIFNLNQDSMKNHLKVSKIIIYFILDLLKYAEKKCSDGTFIYNLRLLKLEEMMISSKLKKFKRFLSFK